MAKRYTLQHYNCYFLSWATIMIIVRTATGYKPGLDAELERGVWPRGLSAVRRRGLGREPWLPEGKRNRKLERVLDLVQVRVLELERLLERECVRVQEQEQAQVQVLVQERKRLRVLELGRKLLEMELPSEWSSWGGSWSQNWSWS